MKFSRRASILLVVMILMTAFFHSPRDVSAQTPGLLYTVQVGDTLSSIARAFHTSPAWIRQSNYLPNGDTLTLGQRLVIPGFEDVVGEAIRVSLPFGESLAAFNRSTHQPQELLDRVNFITSPDQFFAGAPYYIMFTDQPAQVEVPLTAGNTSLELAVEHRTSPWTATVFNDLKAPWRLLVNDVLFFPDASAVGGVLLEAPPAMTVAPFPLLEGKTTELSVNLPAGAKLTGWLQFEINDSLGTEQSYAPVQAPLRFFSTGDGKAVAFQGVHRFTRPGLVPMLLTTTFMDGSTFSMQQNLQVKEMDYGQDVPFIVADNYVDPAVTLPEWQQVKQFFQAAPAEKQWGTGFVPPSPNPEAITSFYGRVRSYNDSPYNYFHSGIDFAGGESTPIFAAAAGEVVFAGELTIRGNTTILSHGWGVYTVYMHQSRIDVQTGDFVEAEQPIGMVGGTGRVTGPHLHFEVIVGGMQVDPEEWLQGGY